MPGYFRVKNVSNINLEFNRKKTIIVGLDYYSFMYVCSGLIPIEILRKHHMDLMNGKVFVYKIYLVDGKIYWQEYLNSE
jgi:hypothetical protein